MNQAVEELVECVDDLLSALDQVSVQGGTRVTANLKEAEKDTQFALEALKGRVE